jgi:hypothetical protein
MPELMQNLIELSVILGRMAEPLPEPVAEIVLAGNLWDEFEPDADGITHI